MKVALLLITLTTIASTTTIPTIQLHQSPPTYSYPAYPDDTCAKIILTNNYFFRLGTNNVITAVNKASLTTTSILLNYTYSLRDLKINTIQDFDVEQNQSLIALAQPSSSNILTLMDFKMNKSTPSNPFSKIQINDYMLAGVMRNNNGQSDIFYQGQLSAAILQTVTALLLKPNNLSTVKNCESIHSPNKRFRLFWDQYSNVFVFNVTNPEIEPVFLGQINSNCTAVNRTETIAFSKDSSSFIIEADDQIPVKIVSLLPQSLLSFQSFSFNATITKAMFLDAQNSLIAIFNDTTVTFIEAATFTVLNRQSFAFSTQHIEVDYSSGMIYVCKDSTVDVYNSSLTTVECPINCQTCLETTDCKVCAKDYTLQNGECQLKPTPTNNTSSLSNSSAGFSNNTDTNNTTSTNSISSTNSSANQTDQAYLILMMPDGSVLMLEMSALQSLILNSTVSSLTVSNNILEYVMTCIASTPFIYLALSNLQFFTVSSLYALLHVPLPTNIAEVLQHTAAAINSNMFTAFNINIQVPTIGDERVRSQRSIQMGVSSQFVQSNYQFFLLSLVSLFVLSGMKGLLHCCQKNIIISGLLRHSTSDVSFGLIVSAMMPFLLPYLAVFLNSHSSSFLDKLNQSIQFIAIGLALLVGGLYIALVGLDRPKSKKRPQKERKGVFFPSLMKETDNLHLIAINLFCPLLVMIEEPLYFLLLNPILLGFGVWTAMLPCKWRANKVILSIHPILFHLCFIIFHFTTNPDLLIYAELVCLISYFLGSAHQLLTMLVSLMHYIYCLFHMKKHNNKVDPLADELKNKAVMWNLKLEKSPAISTSIRSKLPLVNNRVDCSLIKKTKGDMNVNDGLGVDSKGKTLNLRNNHIRSRFMRKDNSPKAKNLLNILPRRWGKYFNDDN